ncbi:MAG: hypothetical protein HY898_14925 [Deltaproteobacteria bacterium]|nr:hypothetical protein [Deltaproteobacteria bacterium]
MSTRLRVLASLVLFGALSGAACTLIKPSHDELSGGDGTDPAQDASQDPSLEAAQDASVEADAKSDGDAKLDGDAGADRDAPDAIDADAKLEADVEAGVQCEAGSVACGDQCVAIDDPVWGCGSPSCSPCALSNSDAGCEAGACSVAACNSGFADCDKDPSTGCEVDLQGDPLNCAKCGAPCTTLPHMTGPCTSGVCGAPQCDTGYQDCNASMVDGCEVNTDGDPTACGGCTNVCSAAPNSTAICTSGQCGIQCDALFGDCNQVASDGCEVDLDTSTSHCGVCDHACALPHAIVQCVSGTCQLSACDAQYGDCNTAPADGCETILSNDKWNCGTCGNHCSGGKQCVNGTCG